MSQNVVYVYSESLLKLCDKNPAVELRASMVHELIKSYKLLNDLEIRLPDNATEQDLRLFHSLDYIDFLKRDEDDDEIETVKTDEFGLAFDCPRWPGLFNYTLGVAGSTLSACDEIAKGKNLVINWNGGWHHAQRDSAGGYCYINDIVLGILKLRRSFQRILYIDLDVHHGDGVENAFATSKYIFTLSFHRHEPGFYPGTGPSRECGFGPGRGYSANFPYKSGISGDLFRKYFLKTIQSVLSVFSAQVFVVQCGGDVIAGDPLGGANLTPHDLGECLKFLLSKNIPTLLLGGGGYNFPNTSRYWTYITALVCNRTLQSDIPDNQFFLSYGPGFELVIAPRNVPDQNTEESLEREFRKIKENLSLCES